MDALCSVRQGNFVIIRSPQLETTVSGDWWMGQIIRCNDEMGRDGIGSAFQVADVDDGSLHWVNAAEVTHVLHALDGFGDDCFIESVFQPFAKRRFHLGTKRGSQQ